MVVLDSLPPRTIHDPHLPHHHHPAAPTRSLRRLAHLGISPTHHPACRRIRHHPPLPAPKPHRHHRPRWAPRHCRHRHLVGEIIGLPTPRPHRPGPRPGSLRPLSHPHQSLGKRPTHRNTATLSGRPGAGQHQPRALRRRYPHRGPPHHSGHQPLPSH